MNSRKKHASRSKLYCIIDKKVLKGRNAEKIAERLFTQGADVIQLRYKNMPSLEFARIAKKVRRLADKCGKIFLINDRVDVASASAAGGVHLGIGDMPVEVARFLLPPKSIIGKTVHSLKEAAVAEKENIDYVGAGPVFYTTIKKNLAKQGPVFIKKIKKRVSTPVYAVGGINGRNLKKLRESGADGFCVARALFEAKNLVRQLNDADR